MRAFRVLVVMTVAAALLGTAAVQAAADPYDELAESLLAEVEEESPTVAVTPFDAGSDGDLSASLVRSIGDAIIAALTERDVAVVERENMDEVIEEIKLQMSGMVEAEDAAELGQALGAGYIVSGAVSEFREPDVTNPGLRIRTRIVSVETARIIATASAEVEKSDPLVAYEPRGRQAASYPTFLEILGGVSFKNVRYPDIDEDVDAHEESIGAGFSAVVRHVPSGSGFIGNSREFNYERATRAEAEADAVVHTFRYNSQVFVRLPMWRYATSLPRLANLYFGLGGGAALTYHIPDGDDYFGVRLATQGFLGFMLPLSPNFALDLQYRLSPRFAGYGWYGLGAEDIDTVEPVQVGAHTVLAGFSFIP